MNIENEVYNFCIKKWDSDDERIQYFQRNYLQWENSLTKENLNFLTNLLKNFNYYSKLNVNNILKEVHSQILELEGLSWNNTIICVLESKRKTINSSYEYTIEYKNINNISKYLFYPEIKEACNFDGYAEINNVILIDDMCGSGNTLKEYLEENKNCLKGKRIIYVVIHIMEVAEMFLNNYAVKNDINLVIISKNKTGKALNNYSEDNRMQVYNESKIHNISDDKIFGYKNSEALVAFYNDTPNNTLGIYRENTEKNIALFPRKKDYIPNWKKMSKDKKMREKGNYYAKKMY